MQLSHIANIALFYACLLPREKKQKKDTTILNIYTIPNGLADEGKENKFCFRSFVDQTLTEEQLVKEIVRYNSTITEADARAMLAIIGDQVTHFVNLGYRVELPFGYAFNKAVGTTDKLNAGFSPNSGDNRIVAVFNLKEDVVREMITDASYRLAGTGYVGLPAITGLYSTTDDGKESDELSFAPLSILGVRGKRLTFDSSDAAQGVFLIDENKQETRLTKYNSRGSNVIEVYVPAATTAGSYKVKVVTMAGVNRLESYEYTNAITITA